MEFEEEPKSIDHPHSTDMCHKDQEGGSSGSRKRKASYCVSVELKEETKLKFDEFKKSYTGKDVRNDAVIDAFIKKNPSCDYLKLVSRSAQYKILGRVRSAVQGTIAHHHHEGRRQEKTNFQQKMEILEENRRRQQLRLEHEEKILNEKRMRQQLQFENEKRIHNEIVKRQQLQFENEKRIHNEIVKRQQLQFEHERRIQTEKEMNEQLRFENKKKLLDDFKRKQQLKYENEKKIIEYGIRREQLILESGERNCNEKRRRLALDVNKDNYENHVFDIREQFGHFLQSYDHPLKSRKCVTEFVKHRPEYSFLTQIGDANLHRVLGDKSTWECMKESARSSQDLQDNEPISSDVACDNIACDDESFYRAFQTDEDISMFDMPVSPSMFESPNMVHQRRSPRLRTPTSDTSLKKGHSEISPRATEMLSLVSQLDEEPPPRICAHESTAVTRKRDQPQYVSAEDMSRIAAFQVRIKEVRRSPRLAKQKTSDRKSYP